MNKLTKIEETPELQMLSESKAEQIKKTFEPMYERLKAFEDDYNDIVSDVLLDVDGETIKKARRLRLDIRKVRTDTAKLKDKQKEYIKLEDKAIMGVHNILVWAVKEKEDKLEEIEKHFENLEKERLRALQEKRADILSEYVEDAHSRDLSRMTDLEFEALRSLKQKEQHDRIEAEKIAEAERLAKEKAEAEERAKIKAENDKLRKEAQEAKAKADAEKREAVRIAREERFKRQRVEAELKAKKETEEKAKADAEAKRQAELSKGDKEKFESLISNLLDVTEDYYFESEQYDSAFIALKTKILESKMKL